VRNAIGTVQPRVSPAHTVLICAGPEIRSTRFTKPYDSVKHSRLGSLGGNQDRCTRRYRPETAVLLLPTSADRDLNGPVRGFMKVPLPPLQTSIKVIHRRAHHRKHRVARAPHATSSQDFATRQLFAGSEARKREFTGQTNRMSRRDVAAIQHCTNRGWASLIRNKHMLQALPTAGWSGSEKNWILSGDNVVRHANHHDQFHLLLRANRMAVLALLWAALAACVVGSLAYDVADWVNAW
jgi:hypothetical protein